MFCQKCGKELPDDAIFCSSCGSSVNANADYVGSSKAAEQKSTRGETLQIVDKLIDYFSAKNSLYRELDRVNCKLVKVNQRSYYWKLLAAISFFGTIGLSLIIIAYNARHRALFLHEVVPYAFLPSTTLGLIVPLIVKIAKKSSLNKRQAELAEEITDYYNQLTYCPIGVEYSDPEILAGLKAIINSGRADTLKEAINTMVDDIHKSNMEAAAFTTAQNAFVAAKAAQVSAVTGTISLFKK